MTRWLNAREWLEAERLSGLPHADFAAEALRMVDEGSDADELYEGLLDDINRATGDVIEEPAQVVECFKWREAVMVALTDAGVHDGDDEMTAEQCAGLLRMFLPS